MRYEFGEIPSTEWLSLHHPETDKQDQNLVQMIWIFKFLDVDVMQLISRYRDNLKIGTNKNQKHLIRKPEDPEITRNATDRVTHVRINDNNLESRTMSSVIQNFFCKLFW